MSQPIRGYLRGGKRIRILASEDAVSDDTSKMSQPIRGYGGHLVSERPEIHKLGRGH